MEWTWIVKWVGWVCGGASDQNVSTSFDRLRGHSIHSVCFPILQRLDSGLYLINRRLLIKHGSPEGSMYGRLVSGPWGGSQSRWCWKNSHQCCSIFICILYEGFIHLLDVVVGQFTAPSHSFQGLIEDPILMLRCCTLQFRCHDVPVCLLIGICYSPDFTIQLTITVKVNMLHLFLLLGKIQTLIRDPRLHSLVSGWTEQSGTVNAACADSSFFFIHIIQLCNCCKFICKGDLELGWLWFQSCTSMLSLFVWWWSTRS